MPKTTIPVEATTALAAAEAIAAELHIREGELRAKISTAARELSGLDGTRQALAHGVANGDPNAARQMIGIRHRRADLEAEISDLQLALEAISLPLAEAELSVTSARREVALLAARGLAEARIALAGRFDTNIAELISIIDEWQGLGHDLIETSAAKSINYETINSLTRLGKCLPKILQKVFPHSLHVHAEGESLAASEAALWRGALR